MCYLSLGDLSGQLFAPLVVIIFGYILLIESSPNTLTDGGLFSLIFMVATARKI